MSGWVQQHTQRVGKDRRGEESSFFLSFLLSFFLESSFPGWRRSICGDQPTATFLNIRERDRYLGKEREEGRMADSYSEKKGKGEQKMV